LWESGVFGETDSEGRKLVFRELYAQDYTSFEVDDEIVGSGAFK
jgi:hypothetical protein